MYLQLYFWRTEEMGMNESDKHLLCVCTLILKMYDVCIIYTGKLQM